MAERIARAQGTHAWLVGEVDGRVVGYSYGGEWMSRAACRWTCTVSVYLEPVVGTFARVGSTHGRWHDAAWSQRPLTADQGPPAPLR